MMFCAYVSTTQAKPKQCTSPAAPGLDMCLFHHGFTLSQNVNLRALLSSSPLRILPVCDDSDDVIAREVNHIAKQPLVGGLPQSPGPAPKFKFVAVDRAVMHGRDWTATVCSHTMAKRIANALNVYKPNREGV